MIKEQEKPAEKILDHLHRNPHAGDTIEGITTWWLESAQGKIRGQASCAMGGSQSPAGAGRPEKAREKSIIESWGAVNVSWEVTKRPVGIGQKRVGIG